MSLLEVLAKISCDGCGKSFHVELDAAEKPSDWSLYDMAEDAVRGGIYSDSGGMTSVQGGKLLCHKCTKICDEYIEDDRTLTDDEVREALDIGRNGL